jgi:hypothetical protein
MQWCLQLVGSIPFPEEPDTLDHNNTTVIMKHAGKEKAETKRCVVLLLTQKYNYTAFGYVGAQPLLPFSTLWVAGRAWVIRR